MKQAIVLCGGKAQRLKPYSWALPKACMPFLNLSLISLSWFYLEELGVSNFFLNSHLFQEKLKKELKSVFQVQQKIKIFYEEEPLGGAGTLYKLKEVLQKKEEFFYINGDSVFFPSSKKQLALFEQDFFSSSLDASFFVSPMQDINSFSESALWCDKEFNLKFIGTKKDKPSKDLIPFKFSGLALFKSDLLDNLSASSFALFKDFIQPLLSKKKIKLFSDKELKILEVGEIQAYLEATHFCLQTLFAKKDTNLKYILMDYFNRFDPRDTKVGLSNGRAWSKKMGYPLLAPKSVQGLEQLQLKGPCVLGADVRIFGKTLLEDVVLDAKTSWRGDLSHQIVMKFDTLI